MIRGGAFHGAKPFLREEDMPEIISAAASVSAILIMLLIIALGIFLIRRA